MAEQIDNGGPAFPCEIGFGCAADNMHQNGSSTGMQYGMSLRDHFASQALVGLMGLSWDGSGLGGQQLRERWATGSYLVADAMLRARRTPPPSPPVTAATQGSQP